MQPTFTDIGGGQRPTQGTFPPTTPVQVNRSSETIRINRNFMIPAIIRFLLIIFQLAGWISAAAVPVLINGHFFLPYEFASTRSAYLFFSIVAFVLSIFIFLLIILNIANVSFFAKLPWILIIFITDVIWMISTFILAIICAVREVQARDYNWISNGLVHNGAFASAAFFGFLCTSLYVSDCITMLMKILRDGVNAKIPSA